ncbi:PiggyBac transposable element-derived protein 4 [Frankliniella fusca]|uniref:PiggyBac transposable element-derived protein 4 n=1 Tax=Frankliniella fusca TaxID=407009 RepID=A0AAE1HX95_9NEOP|nr:PiggyBac transposable element-derived protein 4 [Frankliniella fusca]
MVSDNGIREVKWQDKRTITMLSTLPEHDHQLVDTGALTRGPNPQPVLKPGCVIEYNRTKKGIDVSDQLVAYHATDHKGIKWYRKVAIKLITGVAVVNTMVLMRNFSNPAWTLVDVTEAVARELFKASGAIEAIIAPRGRTHKIEVDEGKKSKAGKRFTEYTTVPIPPLRATQRGRGAELGRAPEGVASIAGKD